ncbi:MAG: SRPBCC family protein [Candidatus Thiodiazotropha lotti]
MKRWCLLLFTLLISFTFFANAHGPTRQKVTVKQMIAAPPQVVWDRVKDFHDMSWHPIIAKTEGDGGNDKGATRVLTLVNGGIINEELKKYDAAKQSFKYKINSVDVKILPVTNYSSTLTVKAAENGGSQVIWKGAFYRGYPNNDPPAELNDQAAKEAVTGVYKSGLENLKILLEKGS